MKQLLKAEPISSTTMDNYVTYLLYFNDTYLDENQEQFRPVYNQAIKVTRRLLEISHYAHHAGEMIGAISCLKVGKCSSHELDLMTTRFRDALNGCLPIKGWVNK